MNGSKLMEYGLFMHESHTGTWITWDYNKYRVVIVIRQSAHVCRRPELTKRLRYNTYDARSDTVIRQKICATHNFLRATAHGPLWPAHAIFGSPGIYKWEGLLLVGLLSIDTFKTVFANAIYRENRVPDCCIIGKQTWEAVIHIAIQAIWTYATWRKKL